jgi:ATP-dependent exoDNAse (exonuclease V) beta subunit
VAELTDWTEGLKSPPSFDELSAVATELEEKVIPRLKKWSKLDLTGSEESWFAGARHAAAAAAGRLAAALAPLINPPREQLAAARAVVAPLLENMNQRRMASGILTFSDLLRRADRLLQTSAGVRREVVGGIDHLLVDEFQDTDDVQCRIVESLALSGRDDRRPALFIVGDPKPRLSSASSETAV